MATKDDAAAVDAHLAGLPGETRRALEELRQLIKSEVPSVGERISYGTSVILAARVAEQRARRGVPSS